MCGRYTLATPPQELIEVFDVPALTFDLTPRFNICPGQRVPVVGEDRRGRRAGLLRWGFVSASADEPGSGWINARGETAHRTPSFREAFARRRCLVPADGFYEWKREGDSKVPHWFHPAEGGLLAFAGIWEHWDRLGREPRDGFAILTVAANADVSGVHDRMPLIIPPEHHAAWLSGDTSGDRLAAMVEPAPVGTLTARVVSTRVNSPREDDPDLLAPV